MRLSTMFCVALAYQAGAMGYPELSLVRSNEGSSLANGSV